MPGPTLPPSFAEGFAVPSTGGFAISAYRVLEAPSEAPALIFAHANSFNAGCYQPLLARLSAHFQVFAYDARGHGASPSPVEDIGRDYAMPRFAEDLDAIAGRIGQMTGPATPLHFASHSLGGLAAILLEAELGQAPFESLTLFEPPIYPPIGHPERPAAEAHAPNIIRWAARRRNHFPDREALREEAGKIVTYRRFAGDMMAAYLEAAVEPVPDGGLILRCPGEIEAAITAIVPTAASSR
jgi:pimeloyl-ACP methyl ester carboxylesterase